MTGAEIFALLVKFGPLAFDYISKLSKVWRKSMTPDEVDALIATFPKTYEEYILQAGGRPAGTVVTTTTVETVKP